ncbi:MULTISPECIES: SIR2 family NAD-dependent protein deacylase [Desulfosediminicola]|uniref:SIR2 family NAD-dependent protein deacylase n=1 Tax=Desulfosediminicola TaxID=2886823 RepID=UPI0010AC6F9D|nr:NAD-dependent deacylase [Desulfosediminicola ganghwensis]
MKTIITGQNEEHIAEAVQLFTSSRNAIALTGAGISVGSGIPDFRSEGGLWSIYSPDEYATLDVFLNNAEKAWELYRDLGRVIIGKKPNAAHEALAEFEQKRILNGIITQNIDNLHQVAGNQYVFEIHGDHQHLHCINCGYIEPVEDHHFTMKEVPHCQECQSPLKPNIVLFGEPVRKLDEIHMVVQHCDLLLVIGTSAQVYPAAGLPSMVKANGGAIFEFNMEPALGRGITDYFFEGDLGSSLPEFSNAVRKTL